jgi:hypothetical protein
MFVPDPDFYSSRIPDPKIAMKDRGEKKISCQTFFFGAINFTKFNFFIFKMSKKKFWPIFKIMELFT